MTVITSPPPYSTAPLFPLVYIYPSAPFLLCCLPYICSYNINYYPTHYLLLGDGYYTSAELFFAARFLSHTLHVSPLNIFFIIISCHPFFHSIFDGISFKYLRNLEYNFLLFISFADSFLLRKHSVRQECDFRIISAFFLCYSGLYHLI